MKLLPLCLLLLLLAFIKSVNAQDSLIKIPDRYLTEVMHKSRQFEQRVNKRTEKVLERLSRQEKKMQKKLSKIDSLAAKNIFTRSIESLGNLKSGLKNKLQSTLPGGINPSNAYVDSLRNTLKFLNQSNVLLNKSKGQLANAIGSVQQLEARLQDAEHIKTYIKARQQELKEQLLQYTGFNKDLQKISKENFYYAQQIREYQSLFQDRKKAEAKAIDLLKKLPAYNDFLQRNSQLAGLFNLSGNNDVTRSIEGLQTRSRVEQLIQQRIGNNPDARQAVSQQMDEARSRFDELKSKFPGLDNAGEMPDFSPREMKTKMLLKRLEPGANIQFQKSNQFFPVTTDIAVQLAYRLNKNSSIGLGAGYKLGLGSDWGNIRFSHRGIGVRCFADSKLRGTFFINGGFEGNQTTGFKNIEELRHWNGFAMSALLGISKKYRVSPKLKGNIMVLYDFLAPRQLPKTDNIKVRFGYSL